MAHIIVVHFDEANASQGVIEVRSGWMLTTVLLLGNLESSIENFTGLSEVTLVHVHSAKFKEYLDRLGRGEGEKTNT